MLIAFVFWFLSWMCLKFIFLVNHTDLWSLNLQTARGKRFFLFVCFCFCFCFVSFNLGAKYGAKSCGFFNISLVELVLVWLVQPLLSFYILCSCVLMKCSPSYICVYIYIYIYYIVSICPLLVSINNSERKRTFFFNARSRIFYWSWENFF